jgi:hypothetical protein
LAKADRISSIDPATNMDTPLFNPRTQSWDQHFGWADDHQTIIGLTPIGRATVTALGMNGSLRREARILWFATGWLP